MCSVHSKICIVDKCDKAVTGKAISGLLFCKLHREQERIRETWGTLTCTKKDCTRTIRTIASGLCGQCKTGKSVTSTQYLKRKRDSK
mmetsp:Transcript_14239/g.14063  ORF Transcript_14239/g.14063 Transcript_14239/m.14063 type:complete len:87 (-) Transcript_14239:253-513(-)